MTYQYLSKIFECHEMVEVLAAPCIYSENDPTVELSYFILPSKACFSIRERGLGMMLAKYRYLPPVSSHMYTVLQTTVYTLPPTSRM